MPDIPARLSAALAERYALERPLGAGGMATVYLARDLRHQRQVAIKVLKPDLAAVLGAERFVQEITTTAALQHPHILPLFDSGTADGFLYYVMPYIEGETLRDKLDRETQLGVDESVALTTAVADALDYAHRHGVIHRDIKPENILLHDGRPMVADFGIALAVSAAAGGRMTETGLSLGTPHYMSPEQATAEKELSPRSDVYSLGSVCYEMLTGDPPHTGASAQQIIMKIVTEEAAPVTKVRKNVPPHVAAAVGKAIEKLPADRFASAREFADALSNPAFRTASTPGGPGGPVRPSVSPSVRRAVPALAAALLVATAAALWGWLRTPTDNAPRVAWRSTIPLPDTVALGLGLALSPDGSELVFAPAAGHTLWHRGARDTAFQPIPGTRDGDQVALSPSGRRLAYVALTGLFVLDLDTGNQHLLSDSLRITSPLTWDGDDHVVVANVGGLFRIGAGGGPFERLTTVDTARGEVWHFAPTVLPDREGIVFTVIPGGVLDLARAELAIVGPGGGEHVTLGPGGFAQAAGKGWLLARSPTGQIVAMQLDPGARRLVGSPSILVDGLPAAMFMRAGQFSTSESGRFVFTVDGGLEGQSSPVLVDRQGRETRIGQWQTDAYQYIAVSPDGSRVAVGVATDRGEELRVFNLASQSSSRIAMPGLWLRAPTFSADGRSITFAGLAAPPTRSGFYRVTLGASGPPELLTEVVVEELPGLPALAPDGGTLWFSRRRPGVRTEIMTLDLLDSTATPTRWTEGVGAKVSPDGRWVAYLSDESGRNEAYLESATRRGGERWQLSRGGTASGVRWGSGGREVYFASPDSMYALAIGPAGPVPPGLPLALFATEGYRSAFDVTPDGSFLMLRDRPEAGAPSQLIMIEDWHALLPK